jgi:cell volume regulation protein A
LRGAVPIVFATYPLLAGIDKADMIFNIVFFISVTSVLIQGTTLPIVAKWLHVALPEDEKPISKTEKFIFDIPKTSMREMVVIPGCYAVDKKIVDLGFTEDTFIAMIKRSDEYIVPSGSTVIEANDTLVVLSENQDGFKKVKECLDTPIAPEQNLIK